MDKINAPILSIPGINYLIGTMILAKISCLNNFLSPNKILAYVGLSLSTYQSCQMQNCYSHTEKRDSMYLKYTLFIA